MTPTCIEYTFMKWKYELKPQSPCFTLVILSITFDHNDGMSLGQVDLLVTGIITLFS